MSQLLQELEPGSMWQLKVGVPMPSLEIEFGFRPLMFIKREHLGQDLYRFVFLYTSSQGDTKLQGFSWTHELLHAAMERVA